MARVVAERRDLVARAARDRLANMLGVHPRDLAGLEAGVATAISDHLNRVNRRIQQLVDQAASDELTGALRRAAGLAALERELQRARRFADSRLVVAFIDVDGLKTVNDSRGHTAGDALLKEVVRCLHERLRAYDLVIRWGGDEFVCVLPEAGLKEAAKVFEHVGREFSSRTGAFFSTGLAEIRDEDTAMELVSRADVELIERRQEGRTRSLAPAPAPASQRRLAVGLASAAAALLGTIALDLVLATPGTLWWLPHALTDTAQVHLTRTPAQAELDLARSRAETAASKPPGSVRQAWLSNARLHLDAARQDGADPTALERVDLLIKSLE
jgi:diguanylate cyclase (GGDEF)-like protein